MPSTLDVSSLEEAVAKTVERVQALKTDNQDLKQELAASKRRVTAAEKKLKKAASKDTGQNNSGDTTEIRKRLQKLEAHLSALLDEP